MTRWAAIALLGGGISVVSALAQKPSELPPSQRPRDDQKQEEQAQPGQPAQEQEPPEEDESLKPKTYAFNPIQAGKELRIGEFYFKKHNFRAAARRFDEATRWDPTLAEAFLRLGEAREKLRDPKAAKAAYAKYLDLAPDSKEADAVRKKIGASAAKAN